MADNSFGQELRPARLEMGIPIFRLGEFLQQNSPKFQAGLSMAQWAILMSCHAPIIQTEQEYFGSFR